MLTENLSTLKIHKLTLAQYDRELAAGNIDENALYLTPDEEIDLSDYATTEAVSGQIDTHNTSTESHADIRTEISDLKTQIADLLYEVISITGFKNNINTAELGSTVTSVTLTWGTNKTPATLTLDGASIDANLTTHTYNNLSLTSDTSYKLVVTDEREASAEKSTSISFVNGVYYGAVDSNATVDSTAILGLTRKLQGSKATTFTTTAGAGQYIVYALPARYGTPAYNVGGFDGGFHLQTTFDFTNASGYTESYNVYYSDNVGLGSTTVKVS